MNDDEEMYDGWSCTGDIIWEHWIEKFAWLPTTVNGQVIWCSTYFQRKGHNMYSRFIQSATLFDVLKN
jgi:hypothetical protein